MRHFLTVLPLLLLLAAAPSWANFGEGQARFQSGDYKGAFEAWLPLAEGGDARAQYSIGVLLEQGLGVEKDAAQAAEWYRRAADAGYAPAAAALRSLQARSAPTAPAATPTPPPVALTEEQQLRAAIVSTIEQANLQLKTGEFTYAGLELTEVAGGFTAVLRDFRFIDGPSEQVLIGDIAANIARDGERYYRIDFRLPDELYAQKAGESGPAKIRIGRQSNSMVWDRALELLTDFDLTWDRLTVHSPEGAERAGIARLAVVSDLVERDGLASGPVTVELAGVEVTDPAEGRIGIGNIRFSTTVDKLDMVRYAELSRGVKQGSQTPEQTLQQLRGLLSAIAVEIGVENLDIQLLGRAPAGLASAAYRLGLSGFDRPLATLDTAYAHAGLRGSEPDLSPLAPRDARIRVALVNLPMETLMTTGLAAAFEYMLFGEIGGDGQVLNQLRLELSNARTELRIDDGDFRGPKLRLTVAGALVADAQALWGLSGGIDLTIAGLDALIEAIEAEGGSAAAGQGGPSFGDMLRNLGRPTGDLSTYLYRFEVDRQGRFLVNGQDATPLLAAFFAG